MSDFSSLQSGKQELSVTALAPSTREALDESARRKGRTIDEEAEHIIKTHLVASGEEEA